MEAWQSVSNSHQEYVLRLSARRVRPQVTLFRDSRYIRKLNSLLSLELGTLDLYQRCLHLPERQKITKCLENHRDNGQQLRLLIIANRGIPDCETSSIPTELCILAQRLGSQLGHTIGCATALKLCENLEQLLRKRYQELIEEAPFRDRNSLHGMLLATNSNLISLSH
ncbi:hypothetical protein [Pseudobacteriovorax antillogorgiicola]|uniref:Uncharacterized protein n=1 Tax=Pseudobacteriovorax antillogorgiicola TaxID=1513793 RepID=A0A1Y6CIH8_9BACT|nr:hypothetical protein [Pseudobacteriovorax antillogorgiicola]TCS48691.1 hypothetical protein EDD56_117113 [Pseudobacteriovorax antillogorgiicola]SMF54787.1 hypothetical protein SAMN06296036_11746 [Pseudobacteriovorax antillogorgiicola]